MGAGKDWAGEENFDPDSKRLLDSACEKGFSLRMMLSEWESITASGNGIM